MFCSKQITSKRVALRLEEEEADPEDEDEEEEEDAGEEPLILFCFVLVLLCFALRRLATRERERCEIGLAERLSRGRSTIWAVDRVAGRECARAERRCVRVALRPGCGMEDGR